MCPVEYFEKEECNQNPCTNPNPEPIDQTSIKNPAWLCPKHKQEDDNKKKEWAATQKDYREARDREIKANAKK